MQGVRLVRTASHLHISAQSRQGQAGPQTLPNTMQLSSSCNAGWIVNRPRGWCLRAIIAMLHRHPYVSRFVQSCFTVASHGAQPAMQRSAHSPVILAGALLAPKKGVVTLARAPKSMMVAVARSGPYSTPLSVVVTARHACMVGMCVRECEHAG